MFDIDGRGFVMKSFPVVQGSEQESFFVVGSRLWGCAGGEDIFAGSYLAIASLVLILGK